MARTSAIDRFIIEAEASGLDIEVQRYPDGTRTAADAAAAVGCKIDQIVTVSYTHLTLPTKA